MSVTATDFGTAQNNVSQLFQQIMKAIDTNKDGQLSESEFATFLSNLTGQLSAAGSNGTSAASKIKAAAMPNDAGAAPGGGATLADPSTWTDNNAPYGVTFAGFSPQNHTNLTVSDLADPLNGKYAAFDYLVSNQIDPNSTTWAAAAADGMNKQFNTNIFHAIDGETLGYGDEYIHTAKNGYGMASGTYSPNATGEFFWGYV
jgi:hypothetical protein